jgi:hypothetical protein
MAKGLGKKRRERAAKAEEARQAEEAKVDQAESRVRTYRGFTFVYNGIIAIPKHKQCFGHDSYEAKLDCDLSRQKCSKHDYMCLEATKYFKKIDNV